MAVSKKKALLEQAQPFLRDQYASMRDELGPRLAHTRDVAVPMAVDASQKAWDVSNSVSHKVRSEYLPVASKRAALAAAALRGAELERVPERHSRWKLVAVITAAGAALGAGAFMWQRKRNHEVWYEEGVDEAKTADGSMPADAAQPEHQHH
jgi:hypothetical protein